MNNDGCFATNIVPQCLLIFLQLQFESQIGANVRPYFFYKFKCLIKHCLIFFHIIGNH